MDKIFGQIPAPKASSCKFLVKGDRIEHAATGSALFRLIAPYFEHRSNVILLYSAQEDKKLLFEQITSLYKNTTIVSADSAINKDVKDVKHVIYDNVIPSENSNNEITAHTALFMSYAEFTKYSSHMKSIYNKAEVEEFLLELAHRFTDSTIIYEQPKERSVNFVFGTNKNLKQVSISTHEHPANTLVFSDSELDKTIENCKFIASKDECVDCSRLILLEIDIDVLSVALSFISDIWIVYTLDDIEKLQAVSDLMALHHIDTPEHIKNMIKSKEQIKN
ncbi:hypothetical protein ENBRE01_0733 [Enteropsectra breve]|nr:hypothetical protein ENBRE01_0733 [Enteropsectra breve]